MPPKGKVKPEPKVRFEFNFRLKFQQETQEMEEWSLINNAQLVMNFKEYSIFLISGC